MYLYKTLYEKFPDHLDVLTQLAVLKICATMDTDMLEKSVIALKDKFGELQSTLTRFQEDYEDVLPVEDAFIPYTSKWIKENKKLLTKLVMMHRRTSTKCDQLSALYKWNLEEHRIEHLFAVCNQFVSDLMKARDDIHKLEIEREKRRKKRERKKKNDAAKEQHEKRKKAKGVQKTKRSILDDAKNRRRKATLLLEKVGAKIEKTLEEKSQLIEAVNYKQKLPAQFEKNKIKRKMSSMYGKSVETVKTVPKGRMRLPTIVSKKELPALPQGAESNSKSKAADRQNQQYLKKLRKNPVQKRKRTKGWFQKGQEPKPPPQMIRTAPAHVKGVYAQPQMSYNPLTEYEQGYKNAHLRARGISNNKEELSGGSRLRSDTPTNPTALAMLSQNDIQKGQQKAVNVHQKWKQAINPIAIDGGGTSAMKAHKRAQSMKVLHSSKNKLMNRAAYSPPNMGIVRLNHLVPGANAANPTPAGSLNLPPQLVDGKEQVFVLDRSPASSPRASKKKTSSASFHFAEEDNWD